MDRQCAADNAPGRGWGLESEQLTCMFNQYALPVVVCTDRMPAVTLLRPLFYAEILDFALQFL